MFRENNVDFESVNYFTAPPGAEKLRELLEKAGLEPFDALRKGEAAFKELNLTRDTPAEEIVRAIVAHPNLLQRPFVEVGERAVLARPIEKALALVGAAD